MPSDETPRPTDKVQIPICLQQITRQTNPNKLIYENDKIQNITPRLLAEYNGRAAAAQVVLPTWTAQDALGRTIGTDAQYGKNRVRAKTVGMFFVVWHGAHGYDHYEARPTWM